MKLNISLYSVTNLAFSPFLPCQTSMTKCFDICENNSPILLDSCGTHDNYISTLRHIKNWLASLLIPERSSSIILNFYKENFVDACHPQKNGPAGRKKSLKSHQNRIIMV